MTYATQSDLEKRFTEQDVLQLSDRDGDGVSDASVIADALSDADGEIDSYIGKRYELPLASVPVALVRVACILAYYNLFPGTRPDGIVKLHDDAIAWLRDIAAGKAQLDIGGEEPASSGDVVLTEGPARIFSRDTLENF